MHLLCDSLDVSRGPQSTQVVRADQQRDAPRTVERALESSCNLTDRVATDTAVHARKRREPLVPEASFRDAVTEEDDTIRFEGELLELRAARRFAPSEKPAKHWCDDVVDAQPQRKPPHRRR